MILLRYNVLTMIAVMVLGSEIANAAGPVAYSPVRDQENVGFCWSYSTIGLMEGEFLKKTGKHVTLSEEYLGFYYLYSQVLDQLPALRFWSRKTHIGGGPILNGIRSGTQAIVDDFFAPKEGAKAHDPYDVLKWSGIVPETFFKIKFSVNDPEVADRMKDFLNTHLLYLDDVEKYENNHNQLLIDMATAYTQGSDAKIPLVTDNFTYEGKSYNAGTFMTDYLGFHPENWQTIQVNASNEGQALRTIRNAVLANQSVPLSFLVWDDYETAKSTGIFDPANCPSGNCANLVGGHSVLIVATIDDQEGNVQSLIVKNSWGLTGLDVKGNPTLLPTSRGFYVIRDGYLREGYHLPLSSGNWTITIPTSMPLAQ